MEQKLYIVCDAGGTKSEWAVLSDDGMLRERLATPGINPSVMPDEEIARSVEEFRKKAIQTLSSGIKEVRVNFYGAGCNSDATNDRMRRILALTLEIDEACIEVDSDIVGAARALFGNSTGIVGILGTGSASALWADGRIADSIPSLGYVLGDEGSGAFMGKTLLNRYFKQELPSRLEEKLRKFTDLSLPTVIERVYRSASPNAYLASMVPFLRDYQDEEAIKEIIDGSLKLFFIKNVLKYNDIQVREIGFVGGVAVAFSRRLMEIGASCGYRVTQILQRPIEALARNVLTEIGK